MSNSFGLTAQPYPTLTDPPGQSYLTQQISDYTLVKTRGELAAERRRIRPAIHRCYIDGCEKKFTTKQNLKSNFFLIYHSPLFLNCYLQFQTTF